MSRGHLHTCDRCGKRYACSGEMLRTDLRKPKVCNSYDTYPKYHPFRLCPDCAVQPQERAS